VKTAQFYHITDNGILQCLLCPHLCTPAEGKTGICGVRRNANGQLISETYGKVSAIHYDPIEKKPLYHFYPGSIILSVGSVGCNLNCRFCQNCDISTADVTSFRWFKDYTAQEIASMAAGHTGNIGIAFTYNEPTISIEYVMDVSRLALSEGLKTAMVTNGFINPVPLEQLLPFMDAFNVDLKAFTEEFYKKHTGSKLAPVLETLRTIRETGKHLEITNLVIPGLNDDPAVFATMIDWIASELGEYTVLHLSRYFPHHKLATEATPVNTLREFCGIAREKLHYVYLGNVASGDGQNTYCPQCSELLINRSGYHSEVGGITADLKCKKCSASIQNLVI
jgi:pyruvate formate lyase activating enzyme